MPISFVMRHPDESMPTRRMNRDKSEIRNHKSQRGTAGAGKWQLSADSNQPSGISGQESADSDQGSAFGEIQNPNIEARNKHEARISKYETNSKS
jgi:hypothetical protein